VTLGGGIGRPRLGHLGPDVLVDLGRLSVDQPGDGWCEVAQPSGRLLGRAELVDRDHGPGARPTAHGRRRWRAVGCARVCRAVCSLPPPGGRRATIGPVPTRALVFPCNQQHQRVRKTAPQGARVTWREPCAPLSLRSGGRPTAAPARCSTASATSGRYSSSACWATAPDGSASCAAASMASASACSPSPFGTGARRPGHPHRPPDRPPQGQLHPHPDGPDAARYRPRPGRLGRAASIRDRRRPDCLRPARGRVEPVARQSARRPAKTARVGRQSSAA
jgi:hypothetical protein